MLYWGWRTFFWALLVALGILDGGSIEIPNGQSRPLRSMTGIKTGWRKP